MNRDRMNCNGQVAVVGCTRDIQDGGNAVNTRSVGKERGRDQSGVERDCVPRVRAR